MESIDNHGTLILADDVAGIFEKLLDFDCKVYTVQDCEAKASKLGKKFKKCTMQFQYGSGIS